MSADPFHAITTSAMQSIWSRSPRGYQNIVIPHVLRMMANVYPPEPVLVVQSTGSGKSTIPLTCSVVDGGVTIIVENTLALGSDQVTKVLLNATNSHKHVKAYQLDVFKSKTDQNDLSDAIIDHCTSNNDTSIIIFSSPETLLKKTWKEFITRIIALDYLRLFCIDEIHLFIEFGISFRKDFQLLKNNIIKMIRKDDGTFKVPIILMTATFDFKLQNLLKNMLAISIKESNTFWGRREDFQKRNIKIELVYSPRKFFNISNQLALSVKRHVSEKMIVICSTAKKAMEIQTKLDSWIDNQQNVYGDTILVIGSHDTELKFAYTTHFTNTHFSNNEDYQSDKLSGKILIGTPGCIGAGLDCSDVTVVCRLGLPTSIINFIQEMGRCGRHNDSIHEFDLFQITFTIEDYVYLIERAYKIDSEKSTSGSVVSENNYGILSPEEERKLTTQNVHELCRMMFLNFGCWHFYLERYSSNTIYHNYYQDYDPCGNNCPYCNGTIFEYVKSVSRNGLTTFLASTMIVNKETDLTPSSLVHKLINFPQVGKVVYGRHTSVKIDKSRDAAVTILQLLCTNILSIRIQESTNPIAYVDLGMTNSTPNYLIDHFWYPIKTIT